MSGLIGLTDIITGDLDPDCSAQTAEGPAVSVAVESAPQQWMNRASGAWLDLSGADIDVLSKRAGRVHRPWCGALD